MALIRASSDNDFTASTISYDPVVTSFIMLGMSYVINNMIYDDCNGRWWQFALAACAMGYGCLAKAVYAPLMLMALFIPKSHFRDDRTRRIVKGGFYICNDTSDTDIHSSASYRQKRRRPA